MDIVAGLLSVRRIDLYHSVHAALEIKYIRTLASSGGFAP